MTDAIIALNIEASDTYFVVIIKRIKVMNSVKKRKGATPRIIPADVATALPPLNPAKTGKVCPSTAKRPINNRDTSISKK